MSYVVLARKMRPMTFDQVVNQKHVVETLKNAIDKQRIANAYVFAGPRGVGKTTIARILAKAINCEQGPTVKPCNECANCVDITNGRSLDVFEIDGASNRGIDEVRNLRENLKYAASKGKHKIYIIDEVHMLTTEAFNALLKTLEEPPSKVMFVFATTEPHKIPATILSRCQRFDFKRIVLKEIIEHLKNISIKENIQVDDEALHLIAKKADGGMRDAQSLLDQAISFCDNEINGKQISELLGIIDLEIFFRATDLIYNKDNRDGLKLIDEIFFNGLDLNEFLMGLNEHLRNILIVKATNSVDTIETTESYAQRYMEQASLFSEEDLIRLIKIVSDTEYTIKRSSNQRLKLELMLMKMIKMDTTQNIESLITGLNKLTENFSASGNKVSYKSRPEAANTKKKIPSRVMDDQAAADEKNSGTDQLKSDTTESDKEVSLDDIKSKWPEIIDQVKKNKIAIGSFLNEGILTDISSGTLIVSFRKENGFHLKTVNQNYRLIEDVLYKNFGKHIKIKCIRDESIQLDEKVSNKVDKSLNGVAIRDPQLKKIIDVFDGELIR